MHQRRDHTLGNLIIVFFGLIVSAGPCLGAEQRIEAQLTTAPAVPRIGETNALFKLRADTDQPVMSAASRVPRARDKAQAQGAGDGSKRPFIIIINFISIGWLLRSALRWTNATRIEPTAASVSDDSSPTTVCQPTQTRARGLGKSTKEEKKYVRGRTAALESTERAAKVPRKRRLLRGRTGWRVHRQLEVAEDFLDDASLHNRRDDPQRAPLAHRTAFHID